MEICIDLIQTNLFIDIFCSLYILTDLLTIFPYKTEKNVGKVVKRSVNKDKYTQMKLLDDGDADEVQTHH